MSETIWLTAEEAAARARVGVKTIYREARAGRLRVARVGGRREIRLKPEWVDEFLERSAEPVEDHQYGRKKGGIALVGG